MTSPTIPEIYARHRAAAAAPAPPACPDDHPHHARGRSMIRIKSPGPNGYPETTTADGSPIPGIARCTIQLEPDDIIWATVEIYVNAIDIEAHPLLGIDTLTESAAHYGYRLVPLDTDSGDAA